MSPTEALKLREGSEALIGIRLRAEKVGEWIQIHITGTGNLQTSVTNDPSSSEYHQALYRDLRKSMFEQGCWPYEDGAHQEEARTKAQRPRFQPVRAKNGASASEIVLHDRGAY